MKFLDTDVLIIGAGAAGLRSAQYASKTGCKVLIVTPTLFSMGGTTNADVAEMAGFNSATPGNDVEIEKHYQDMVAAGQDVLDPSLAEIIAVNAPKVLMELCDLGVSFERNDDGSLYRFQSCFSSYPRTQVIKGHGHQIASIIRNNLAKMSNVTTFQKMTIISLIVTNGECFGAFGVSEGVFYRINAKSTIIASGGAGASFERCFCPKDVCGSGYELAYEAGAVLENLEFMQMGIGFSYPVVNIFNSYIWEALPILADVNGEGIFSSVLPEGKSYNDVAEDHKWHYPFSTSDGSKYLEIAISKTISDGKGTKNRGIKADLRHLTDDYIHTLSNDCGLYHMWPIARDFMKSKGVDLLNTPVELSVFQHAMNGGIKIDRNAQSTIPGLYAVGECAGGPHGADRLGGNMFVTCMVYGEIAGKKAAERAKDISGYPDLSAESVDTFDQKKSLLYKNFDTKSAISGIKKCSQDYLLVMRYEEGLDNAIKYNQSVQAEIKESHTGDSINEDNYRAYSMAKSMELLAASAKERKESRGSHHRWDYPDKNSSFNGIIEIKK